MRKFVVLLAVAGLIALGGAGYVAHCQHVKADYKQFVAQLEADAAAQRKGLAAKEARERKAKEEADAQTARNHAALQRTIRRLRDDRARASSVPAAAPDPYRPDLACFDRAELTRAVGNLEAGVEGLAAEGSEASADLDVARAWAMRVNQP